MLSLGSREVVMKLFLVLALVGLTGFPSAARAQIFSGPATALDGDSLEMTGARIRLFGIDAVELEQTCQRGGEAWGCGHDAKAWLARIISGRTLEC